MSQVTNKKQAANIAVPSKRQWTSTGSTRHSTQCFHPNKVQNGVTLYHVSRLRSVSNRDVTVIETKWIPDINGNKCNKQKIYSFID